MSVEILIIFRVTTFAQHPKTFSSNGWRQPIIQGIKNQTPPHCTEIDFALSFGAVIVKMIDLYKTDSRDFFGIILDQESSQKLHLLPKSC